MRYVIVCERKLTGAGHEDAHPRPADDGRGRRPTHTFADPKRAAKDEDPATTQLRKELAAAEERKKAERLARLKQLKQETTMKTSSKKKAPSPAAKPAKAPKPAGGGKAAAKANARTRASAGPTEAGSKAVRPGSKLEIVVGLLTRKEGCTTAMALAQTGWPSISMPQQARAAGLTLTKEKKDGVTVYHAAPAT